MIELTSRFCNNCNITKGIIMKMSEIREKRALQDNVKKREKFD